METKKLYRFNILLIIIALIMFISSIPLAVSKDDTVFTSINRTDWIYFHIISGILFFVFVTYHIIIHWGHISKWFKRAKNANKKLTVVLFYLSLLVVIMGIIAVFPFLSGENGINIAGKLHGKLGLAFIIVNTLHLLKYLKWFKGRKQQTSFVPTIDADKCVKCCKCVKNCPAQILTLKNKAIIVERPEFCVQCKKCVHICPKDAIS